MTSRLLSFLAFVIFPIGIFAGAAPGNVQPIALDLPISCRLGENCWIANYVDVDPGADAKDFRCESRTYDGHDGIDLAIRDLSEMERGVPVQAVAPGVVRHVRDGAADAGLASPASRETVAGRECGNGVIIDHDEGWQTQYCHLKQHSLQVKIGQQVERQQILGQVGLSGQTEFPHVHLAVRHDGHVIDPFTGQRQKAGCQPDGRGLWRDPAIAYEEVALYHLGFASEAPEAETARQGRLRDTTVSADVDRLVLWVDMFGVQAKDQLRFRIVAPDGRMILDQITRIDRTQARRFSFVGVRRQIDRWLPGTYYGEVRLQRGKGNTAFTRSATAEVHIF